MSLALHTHCIIAIYQCVRAYFKNINEVVETIKTAIIKNKDRKKDFHEACWPSLLDPMIARWKIWLRTALCHCEYFLSVSTFINNWPGDGLLVSRAKKVINVDNLVPNLVCINQYRSLAANVEFLTC